MSKFTNEEGNKDVLGEHFNCWVRRGGVARFNKRGVSLVLSFVVVDAGMVWTGDNILGIGL